MSDKANLHYHQSYHKISMAKMDVLCGKQGLSLRGHRDDHINWIDSEPEGVQHSNQGNFVELVCFRAEHDQILIHFKNNSK